MQSNSPARPEYRQDSITGNWVVIATSRSDRPIEFESPSIRRPSRQCPFCPGNEESTPDASLELFDPNDGSWQVRVVANLYPAFDATFHSDQIQSNGLPAFGSHEVIIESSRHVSRLTELTDAEVAVVFEAYQQRLRSLADDDRIAYGLLFKNCGLAAGISLEHVHSQLVALPIVPPVVDCELRGARARFTETNRCAFCDIITQSEDRIVDSDDRFVALCPFASRFPYETWILPRRHSAHYYTEDHVADLGRFVCLTLRRLEHRIPGAAYNMILHSSPFDSDRYDYYHWHIEIIPRLATVAGLEWGSGIHVNVVPPETAASQLADQGVMPN